MQEEQKTKGLYTGSLCRYAATLKHLEKYFHNQPLESIGDTQAQEFAIYLRKQVSKKNSQRLPDASSSLLEVGSSEVWNKSESLE